MTSTLSDSAQTTETSPRTYEVRTFGCQMNVHDSERMSGLLEANGYVRAEEGVEPDLVVFNTCAVRENAANRLYGNLGQLAPVKRRHEGMQIAVGGCLAQKDQDAIIEKAPWVDVVFGTHNIGSLPALLERARHNHEAQAELLESLEVFPSTLPTKRDHVYSGWVSISVGCNNTCTFCIVPSLRGKEKDRRPGDVLAEVQALVDDGAIEVTLLGQNVNSYGKGLPEDITFAALLRMLDAVPGDYRIRFMTSHPKDATRELIDTIANSAHISRHLHLPVQSGSNSILAQMNRKYTVEDYLSLIAYAKRRMPEMTYSSDIIVGFPGETEEDFCATEALIREVEYMQLFTFIYSKRTGTAAASMPDPTPHKEKTQRIARVLAIQEQVVAKLGGAMVGKTVRALVEGPGREEGTLTARLDNNMTVDFAGGAPVGEFADVRVTGVRGAMLKGELG